MTGLFAELEGEATNLDAYVAKRLYVHHSQLRTPHLWPRNCIRSYSYGQQLLYISSC